MSFGANPFSPKLRPNSTCVHIKHPSTCLRLKHSCHERRVTRKNTRLYTATMAVYLYHEWVCRNLPGIHWRSLQHNQDINASPEGLNKSIDALQFWASTKGGSNANIYIYILNIKKNGNFIWRKFCEVLKFCVADLYKGLDLVLSIWNLVVGYNLSL